MGLKAIFTCMIKSTSKTRELTKTLKNFDMPTVFVRDIEKLSDKTVRNCFSDYALRLLKQSSKQNTDDILRQLNKDKLWQMDDIIQKLNMCTDKTIKTQAEYLLLDVKSKSGQDLKKIFNEVEQLLDCSNTMNGKYSSLFRNSSVADEFYEALPRLKSKGDKETIELYKECAYSDTRRLSKSITNKFDGSTEVIKTNIDEKILEYITKNQDIKEYISTASKNDYVARCLYRKYLETQPKEIMYKLEDIYYKYGIHTFVDKGASKDTLNKLKRLEYELQQQLKTSNGNVDFPNLLDITKYDPYCISHSAGGYAFRGGEFHSEIVVKSDDIATIYRHESVHLNDKILDNGKPKWSEMSKKDFLNGNFSVDNILQLTASRAEKIAHSAELDMAKISQATKDELISEGLKPFYTRMESLKAGNRKFLKEEFYLYRKEIETLIEHSKYGANEEFVMDILKNRDKLDFKTIKYLFRKNPEYKFRNVEELLGHSSNYNENFIQKISAYFDKSAVSKIQNNRYIDKEELLSYIAKHADDREIINKIVNENKIMKISDIDFYLEYEKLHKELQRQIIVLQGKQGAIFCTAI